MAKTDPAQPMEGQPVDVTNAPKPAVVQEVEEAGQPVLLDAMGQEIPYLIGEPTPWVVNPEYINALRDANEAANYAATHADVQHAQDNPRGE